MSDRPGDIAGHAQEVLQDDIDRDELSPELREHYDDAMEALAELCIDDRLGEGLTPSDKLLITAQGIAGCLNCGADLDGSGFCSVDCLRDQHGYEPEAEA